MMVCHGSFLEVSQPDVLHSRKSVDFGAGFYVTPLYQQAKSWAEKFRDRKKPAVVTRYTLDEDALKGLNVCQFDSYSEEWLDFVLACRSRHDKSSFDVVIGGVANDKVFNTVELYFDGLIDKKEALRRLIYEKPNLQICFRTQFALDCCLRLEGSETL